MEYLADRLEAFREELAQMNNPAEALDAARRLAATLKPALPSFHADIAEQTRSTALKAIMNHHVAWLRAEAERLAHEEGTLRDAEEARRRVPRGKHYERITRAMRETNREIKYLERSLGPLRSPFVPKAR